MILRPTSLSLRFLLGSLAASLGFAGVASAAVATPTTADPVEGSNPIQPDSIHSPGTYVSCSAYFGLSKYYESDLVSYAVDVIDNAVTPEPVIGVDLVPILTVTGAEDETIECIPELAWTDETAWGSTYFPAFEVARMSSLVTYPGATYYAIPVVFGLQYITAESTAFTPVSTSIRFENTYTGKVITVDPAAVSPTADGVFTENSVVLADLDNSFFTDLFNAVETTGDAAQRGYFRQWWVDKINSVTCSESDPFYAATAATMMTLVPGVTVADCTDFYSSSLGFYEAAQFNAKIAASLITITIADPPPPTTTTTITTTTTTTPTTTTVQSELVLPAFTG
ncbi:hypothetical protein MCETE7_01425 [Acidimicrobiia bacterium]